MDQARTNRIGGPGRLTLVTMSLVFFACVRENRRLGADAEVGASDVAETVLGDAGPDASDGMAEETAAEVADVGDEDADPTDTPHDDVDAVDAADTAEVADTRAEDSLDGSDADATDATDAGDAGTSDGGEVVDAGDVADAETADADAAEVAEVAECGSSADCADKPVAPQCQAWTCRGGTCALVAAAESSACDDGDACTVGDVCRSGVCQSGPGRLECPSDAGSNGCRLAACHPAAGCGFTAAAVATRCSNGVGVLPGTCVRGGYQAEDQCNGLGQCVDATAPDPLTSPAPRLVGSWLLAYWTFGRYLAPATGRAVLEIDGPARELLVTALHELGTVPFDPGDDGYLCTRDDGTLEVRLGARRLIGHQLDEGLAVVTDTSNDAIAVLARADTGRKTQVSGTYSYLQTTIVFGTATPTTWRGELTFAAGCLMAGSFGADPAISGPFDFTPAASGDCLVSADEQHDEALFELVTSVRARAGGSTYPIHYRGAVVMNGDVVLLIKEVDATSPAIEYGVTLLVRDSGGPFAQSELAGPWRYNLHAKLGASSARRDVGSVTWDATGAITGGALGTLDGTVLTPSGWGAMNVDGNGLSQRVALPGLEVYQSGFIDPSARLIVGWVVSAPADGSQPSALSDVPLGGSTLIMLRPD